MTIRRSAVTASSVPEVTENWEGYPPQEVLDMLEKFVSPKNKNPGSMTIGADLSFKDYGSGWGAFVSVTFPVDADTEVVDQANTEVGELVRNYAAENYAAAEDLWRQLQSR